MSKNIKFSTAGVAQANTPETDAMEFIYHDVEIVFDDDSTIKERVMARCPIRACELVRAKIKAGEV